MNWLVYLCATPDSPASRNFFPDLRSAYDFLWKHTPAGTVLQGSEARSLEGDTVAFVVERFGPVAEVVPPAAPVGSFANPVPVSADDEGPGFGMERAARDLALKTGAKLVWVACRRPQRDGPLPWLYDTVQQTYVYGPVEDEDVRDEDAARNALDDYDDKVIR